MLKNTELSNEKVGLLLFYIDLVYLFSKGTPHSFQESKIH